MPGTEKPAGRAPTGSYTTSLWLIAGVAGLVAALALPLTRERLARAAASAAGGESRRD